MCCSIYRISALKRSTNGCHRFEKSRSNSQTWIASGKRFRLYRPSITKWAASRPIFTVRSSANQATVTRRSTVFTRPANAAERALARLALLDASTSGEYAQCVADDIRTTMQAHAGVFRTAELL